MCSAGADAASTSGTAASPVSSTSDFPRTFVTVCFSNRTDGWIASGELIDHMTFEKVLKELALDDWYSSKKAEPLVWFPGNEMLLAYEMLILDREVDAAIWKGR